MDALFSTPKWSLESDKQLFVALEQFSQSMVGRADAVLSKLDKLERKLEATERNMMDASNQLQSLRNNQFIHSKVLEIKEEIAEVRKSVSKPDQGGARSSGMVLLHGDEIDLLNERPLPYIIGSDEFYADPNVGLTNVEHADEDDQIADVVGGSLSSVTLASQPISLRAEEDAHANLIFGSAPPPNESEPFKAAAFIPQADSAVTQGDIKENAVPIRTRTSMEEDDDLFSATHLDLNQMQVTGNAAPLAPPPPMPVRHVTAIPSPELPKPPPQAAATIRPPPPPPPPRVTRDLLFDDVDDLFGDSVAPFSGSAESRPTIQTRQTSLFEDDNPPNLTIGSAAAVVPPRLLSPPDLSRMTLEPSRTSEATGATSRALDSTNSNPTVADHLPPAASVQAKKKRGLFDDDEEEDDDDGLVY